jgi:HEAT repeat protein
MSLFGPPDIKKMLARLNVNGLIRALDYHKNKNIQIEAIEALGELGDKRAVEPLISRLLTSNEGYNHREYHALIHALGNIGDVRAIKPLIDAYEFGPKDDVVESLVKIGTPVVEPLIFALLKQNDRSIKVCAVRALGKIGDRRAVKPLVYAYKETRNDPVYHANIPPGSGTTTEGYERIEELSSESAINAYRCEITYAVRNIGQSSIPILRELLFDKDDVIQVIAKILLDKLNYYLTQK